MPARTSLVTTLWLTYSLVILAWVLVAPLQSSEFSTVSPRPDGLGRNLALPGGQPATHLSSPMATDAVVQLNALPSENEEQDQVDALDEPRVSFLISCSFRKVADRHSIVPRSIPSLYPLRC